MELQRYDIDIATLSETRFAGEGQLTENNYTFYWKEIMKMNRECTLLALQKATRLSPN